MSARRLVEAKTEALRAAMPHRKATHPKPAAPQHRAGIEDDETQRHRRLPLRPQRGQIALDELERLRAAADCQLAAQIEEAERCHEPGQPQHMIEMRMRQQSTWPS